MADKRKSSREDSDNEEAFESAESDSEATSQPSRVEVQAENDASDHPPPSNPPLTQETAQSTESSDVVETVSDCKTTDTANSGDDHQNESEQCTGVTNERATDGDQQMKPAAVEPETQPSSYQNQPHNTQQQQQQQQPIEQQQQKQQQQDQKEQGGGGGGGGGWGWGGWGGLSSLVSGSAQALGRGIGSVVSTVEETLGVPSPDEIAASNSKEEKKNKALDDGDKDPAMISDVKEPQEPKQQLIEREEGEESEGKSHEQSEDLSPISFGGFWSGITSAGKGIVSGGLDALESIGRKTVDLISEGDPGLRKKRALLSGEVSLSQLLREAKEKAKHAREQEAQNSEEVEVNYSILFDEYGGLVHLEALELLSKECSAKLKANLTGFTGVELDDVKGKMSKLSTLFEMVESQLAEDEEGEEEELSRFEEVKTLLDELKLPVRIDKLLKVTNQVTELIAKIGKEADGGTDKEESSNVEGSDKEEDPQKEEETKTTVESLYKNGLQALAEVSTAAIELLRKTGEFILLPQDNSRDIALEAKKMCRIAVVINRKVERITSLLAEQMTLIETNTGEGTNPRVTSLYLESSNSCSYIQDAFQLLLPVLQLQMVHYHHSSTQ